MREPKELSGGCGQGAGDLPTASSPVANRIFFRREEHPGMAFTLGYLWGRLYLDGTWPERVLIGDVALEWLGNAAQIGDGLITFRLENACATYALEERDEEKALWKAKKLCEWSRSRD